MSVNENDAARGPLSGLRIVEIDAIGPVPLLGVLLADFGADIVRIVRPNSAWSDEELGAAILHRSRCNVKIDLKTKEGQVEALDLIAKADGLIEGSRPGVMERLNLGPDECLARNPMLVYGRMTGWGQTGPRALQAGHDINYLALSGALGMIGLRERPVPPLNLITDYGGGSMFLAFGMMAALFEARASGKGQVVDAAMVDGTVFLLSLYHFYAQSGQWSGQREDNLLDGGAPYYRCYLCADGGFIAVGALEPQFYSLFMTGIGLDPSAFSQQDRANWPAMQEAIAAKILTRTRDEWAALFQHSDACVTPVLSLEEARQDPHHVARGTYFQADDYWQASPAPRLDRTPAHPRSRSTTTVSDVLAEWG